MGGLNFALQYHWFFLSQKRELTNEVSKTIHGLFPLCFVNRIGRPAFRCVLGIAGPLALNSLDFIVHPVIHVKNLLPDGVLKSSVLARGSLRGEIFYALYRANVCPLAVQEFN